MNIGVMHHALTSSLNGTMAFREVVGILTAEGVESYHADLVRMEDTFYMPDGSTHVEKIESAAAPIASEFSKEGVVSAIRAAQAGECKYRAFLNQITAAGTTNYMVYLNGRRAIYFGRKGEYHVEEFPRQ